MPCYTGLVDVTWFDLIMMTLLAGVVVIGARRGVAGLVAGLGALLAWVVINIVAGVEPLLGLFLGAATGFGLAMLAKYINTIPAFQTGSELVSSGMLRTSRKPALQSVSFACKFRNSVGVS